MNEYEITSTDDKRRRRLSQKDDITSNGKEMISFIQPNGDIDTDDKFQS